MIDPEIRRSPEEMQWLEQKGFLAHHVAKSELRIFACWIWSERNFGIRFKIRQSP
jgi:hypothetical protein